MELNLVDKSTNNNLQKHEYNKLRYEQLPWSEKYRPMFLRNLILNDTLKIKITNFITEKNLPNLILTGSHGTGKTSTMKCIINELYGEYGNNAVFELNLSDNKSTKIIQTEIISFCKSALFYKEKDKQKYAKFKLIVFDEADNIENRVQSQINTIMEKYKNTIKFAFTCNTSANIIEAIQSRCSILRYSTSPQFITSKLKHILDNEKISYDDEAMEQISNLSRGDMRSAINMIQLIHNKFECVKINHVDDMYDIPQHLVIKKMLIL